MVAILKNMAGVHCEVPQFWSQDDYWRDKCQGRGCAICTAPSDVRKVADPTTQNKRKRQRQGKKTARKK